MTDTAAASVPPNLRDRTPLALAGVVVAYAVLNSIASTVIWIWPNSDDGVGGVVALGVLVFQPVMFGVWTALGAGSILTRLPIAVPCLMLQFVVPGYLPAAFADLERKDFIATVLTGFTIYAAAIIFFLAFRRFTGFRIQPHANQLPVDNTGVGFSIQYLFALTTVYAVALSLTTQLKFQTTPPAPNFLFGSDFFIAILAYGGAILSAAVLPTIAVPLSILHGHPTRRAVKLAITLWAVVTLSVVVFVLVTDGGPLRRILGPVLLAQFGAALAGALTAIPLRFAGLQLVRYRSQSSSISSPAPSP